VSNFQPKNVFKEGRDEVEVLARNSITFGKGQSEVGERNNKERSRIYKVGRWEKE
jgi:hypothetical protein